MRALLAAMLMMISAPAVAEEEATCRTLAPALARSAVALTEIADHIAALDEAEVIAALTGPPQQAFRDLQERREVLLPALRAYVAALTSATDALAVCAD